jgi:hypothetical protein
MLLCGVNTATHLQRAVDSRDLIGQAKGLLRERFKVDDEKLTAVAQWLLDNADTSGPRPEASGVLGAGPEPGWTDRVSQTTLVGGGTARSPPLTLSWNPRAPGR